MTLRNSTQASSAIWKSPAKGDPKRHRTFRMCCTTALLFWREETMMQRDMNVKCGSLLETADRFAEGVATSRQYLLRCRSLGRRS